MLSVCLSVCTQKLISSLFESRSWKGRKTMLHQTPISNMPWGFPSESNPIFLHTFNRRSWLYGSLYTCVMRENLSCLSPGGKHSPRQWIYRVAIPIMARRAAQMDEGHAGAVIKTNSQPCWSWPTRSEAPHRLCLPRASDPGGKPSSAYRRERIYLLHSRSASHWTRWRR